MPALVEVEKQLLVELMEKHGGSKQAVANELGVCLKTLYHKLKKFKVGDVRSFVRSKPKPKPQPKPEPEPKTGLREPPTPAHPHQMHVDFAARVAEQIALQLEAGHIEGARRTLEVEWQRHLLESVPLTAQQILDLPLASTELELRIVNALEELGILTLGQLLHTPPHSLLSYRMISAATLKVIRTFAGEWANRYCVAQAAEREVSDRRRLAGD